MLRWYADAELNLLLRRYYAGEAGLWGDICRHIDAELHRRGIVGGAYHVRFRALDAGFEVIIEDANNYVVDNWFQ